MELDKRIDRDVRLQAVLVDPQIIVWLAPDQYSVTTDPGRDQAYNRKMPQNLAACAGFLITNYWIRHEATAVPLVVYK